MYAIVEDSGTQIKLSTGDVFNVDLRDVEGDAITLDNVLMISGDGEPTIGTPYVEGASVAVVLHIFCFRSLLSLFLHLRLILK